MKRLFAFLLLLLIFALWTFPHRRIVEQVLKRRLGAMPVEFELGKVRPKVWPLGYSLADVRVRSHGVTVSLEAIRLELLFGSDFSATACGGSFEGRIKHTHPGGSGTLELSFNRINPGACIEGAPIAVSGTFTGDLALKSLERGGHSALGHSVDRGTLTLTARNGTIAGYLPGGKHGETGEDPGKPIGSWGFVRIDLQARFERGAILVEKASADAENVHWELAAGRIAAASSGRTRVSAELKARRLEDSPRAKAVLGVLPRAGENAEGWRRYRISGTLDSPKIIGLK